MIYIVLCIFYSSNQSKIFRNYILSNICVTLEASPQTSMENYWFKLNKGDSSMQSAFNRTALDKKQFHLNIKIIFSMLQSVLILSLISCGFTKFQINVFFIFFFHKTSHESCIISFCIICFLEHSPLSWKEGFLWPAVWLTKFCSIPCKDNGIVFQFAYIISYYVSIKDIKRHFSLIDEADSH